ncbi:MAG: hypothetical protein UT54_C0003G0024 [Candidatus Daviesbacteria bacterium GW2011_GWB1_39_5]|uniref:Uncharacterized protein n=1 Tax=Candidatus Daviesbacteria bacterium GW2011_GWC2_40_12 TaxID=1618431 RepID=A0A0G0QRQ2_9BACT|nr:MAG: hypothetical protein UT04_C0047G0002 [Candidatus Daviesbacteria bacterium GW2011_GWF2_38_7]KKR17456.1 MAG: hypothetical protein UT45_C0001G0131 [Candidatus Daviesbacteria bacterium GW2011_GWA2_39_33]KKR25406.1 MAG: hypothetical protein UT54_C0003G0024 [Candidatus Daviesbacteria bacterium GW2011_GWB1_39_5]KKR42833.1 MAG: hypothetical protein UT77_C0001G0284 [Candidatus Daviesbacteria bacterium GW2011_GWC2_40_12]OGE21589.1 MAG: hypothetical protein A2778_05380 [Candidatus Daviesbacteria b
MDNLYPEWKKVAWRFIRVFISAFLFTGSLVLMNAQPESLTNEDKFLNTLIMPFFLSGAIAGINAVGKLLRDLLGSKGKDGLVDKLPF